MVGMTWREMLRRSGLGFGSLALAGLVARAEESRPRGPLEPRAPHVLPPNITVNQPTATHLDGASRNIVYRVR